MSDLGYLLDYMLTDVSFYIQMLICLLLLKSRTRGTSLFALGYLLLIIPYFLALLLEPVLLSLQPGMETNALRSLTTDLLAASGVLLLVMGYRRVPGKNTG